MTHALCSMQKEQRNGQTSCTWRNSKHYYLKESNKSRYQRGKGSSNLSSKKYSNVNYQVGIYCRKSSAKKDDISIHERQDEKKLRDKSNQKFAAKLAKICVL